MLSKKQLAQEQSYSFPYHFLDFGSDAYKYIWNIEYRSYMKRVIDILGGIEGKTIIDAGCGDGRLLFELKNKNANLIGIDYSEKAINFAKLLVPTARFYVTDLSRKLLNIKSDTVVLMETLEHIKPGKVAIVISNVSKILKKGGKFIITVPSINVPLPEKHYQHFDVSKIEDILSKQFYIRDISGNTKTGNLRKLFFLLQIFGNAVLPLKIHFPFIEKYYSFLKNYFTKHLDFASPDKAERLIVIAERK